MALAGKLFIDARSTPRRRIDGEGTLRDSARRPIDVRILDLSETGFRVVCDVELAIGDEVSLGFGGWGARAAEVVRSDGDSYGCAFMSPLPPGEIERARAAAIEAEALFPVGEFPQLPPRRVEEAATAKRLPLALRAGIIVGLAALTWVILGVAAWLLLA